MKVQPRKKLNLAAREYRDDPWTKFREIPELGPVVPIKLPLMGKCWGATTYEAVNDVLKNDEPFAREPANAGRKNFIPMQWILPKSLLSVTHNMLASDGLRHRRLRSLVDQAFARRNVDGIAGQIELVVQNQLDLVAHAATHNEDQVDLIEHFARPFPLTVICELLGFSLEDRPKFRKWFAPFSTVTSMFGIFKIGSAMRSVLKYLKAQIEEVRTTPRDGLMSELVQAKHEGEQLDEKELLSMVFLLLIAGHETTVHLISNMLLTLLQLPNAKRELMSDWSNADAAVEEVLRYASPIQIAKPRFIANDIEFYGQSLRRGEMITPIIAAANYDPARFENPDRFDMHRSRNYHMTFGSGPHVCLGMKLARVETRVATQCLFERWPNLQLAFDPSKPFWSKRIGTRGLQSFPVKLQSTHTN